MSDETPLRSISLFDDLSPAELSTVAASCTIRTFEKQAQILGEQEQTTDVFFILSGTVRSTSYTSAGREVIYNETEAGEIFGIAGVADARQLAAACIAQVQEAECAELRGMHGIRNGAVGRENNDLQARPTVLQLLQQPDAVHVIHPQIGDHQVRTEPAGGSERLYAALNRFDIITFRTQADGQQAQQARVIINHQDARLTFSCLIQVPGP